MKDKVKILCYECNKCNFNKEFLSNEQINTRCKICGNEMTFYYSRNYNPNKGLKAIKDSNLKQKPNTEFFTAKEPKVECPYCKSTNTKKITNMSKAIHTALFGVFSISRNSKQYHCNNCNSDF